MLLSVPVVYQKMITRVDLKANPHITYVFGDNVARVGLGGQAAACRGEPNALGIPTKWSPKTPFNEASRVTQNLEIDKSIMILMDLIQGRNLVVFPSMGIGTGLAALKTNSPSSWYHLMTQLERLHIRNPIFG
jgi:hypothetical protein